MKFTNQEIINALNALDSLSQKELPILLTYQILEIHDYLMELYKVYSKALSKAKNDDEIKELLNIEKEISIPMLNKQDLIDADVTLTPVQLAGIRRLIIG